MEENKTEKEEREKEKRRKKAIRQLNDLMNEALSSL
jgi:hypothetical protein